MNKTEQEMQEAMQREIRRQERRAEALWTGEIGCRDMEEFQDEFENALTRAAMLKDDIAHSIFYYPLRMNS